MVNKRGHYAGANLVASFSLTLVALLVLAVTHFYSNKSLLFPVTRRPFFVVFLSFHCYIGNGKCGVLTDRC